jgi:PIN domain nuclease of toxin-antitoxin system
VRLLLDTHVALWAILDDPRLPSSARSLIADRANTILVSVASVWEITIKFALARGGTNDMLLSGEHALKFFRGSGCAVLPITAEHVVAVGLLPPLHRDPFDRLLVAQAHVETLRLITSDMAVGAYGGPVMVV